MVKDVEISSLDLRYESCRMKHDGAEKVLLRSILECGIREPLEGVDTKDGRILLNGFKRCRCAKKLNITIVPYTSLGSDEAMGIIQLLRVSNAKSLTILEQASLIDDLKKVHVMSVSEIADQLERSKSWVSMRIGILSQISDCTKEKIFAGEFPLYAYMYILRQFIRMNSVKRETIDEFVNSVAGRQLSIRDIERLAYSYFNGSDEFKEQIKNGNISWVLERFKEVPQDSDACNEVERGMIKDLEILQKYMQKVIRKSNDKAYGNNSFYAQANLLAGGILSKVSVFSKILREFYDRTGQA